MALVRTLAISAAALLIGMAGAAADESPAPGAPSLQAPELQTAPELDTEGAIPQDGEEADPFGRAPGCPLRDKDAPRLLIG